jgi:hypothetical protein
MPTSALKYVIAPSESLSSAPADACKTAIALTDSCEPKYRTQNIARQVIFISQPRVPLNRQRAWQVGAVHWFLQQCYFHALFCSTSLPFRVDIGGRPPHDLTTTSCEHDTDRARLEDLQLGWRCRSCRECATVLMSRGPCSARFIGTGRDNALGLQYATSKVRELQLGVERRVF